MDIKGYTFITGKTVYRPWGVEYRYTVQNNETNKIIDDIILPENDSISEDAISILITNRLLLIDKEPELSIDPIEEAIQTKENEIHDFLVAKELITADQSIWDIPSKDEIVADASREIG